MRLFQATLASFAFAFLSADAQADTKTAAASNRPGVAIATGGPAGVYFPVGNAICRLLARDHEARPGLPCVAEASAGSLQNIDELKKGVVDVALVQSDVLFQAARGLSPRDPRKFDKSVALFSLYSEPFQLLAAARLGIASPADLAGHKLNVGPKGVAQYDATFALLRLHKLDEKAFPQLQQLGIAEAHQAFCAGDVDAFGMFIGLPNTAYARDIAKCDGALVDVDTDEVREMLAATPYFAPVVIPRSVYPGLRRDVKTFGVLAVATTTTDLPEEVAYRIAKTVMEGIDELKAMHPALATLDPRAMTHEGITVPLHPGAARYYRERGWLSE